MLEAYGPFILRTASGVLRRYVTQSDDAWSVSLIAFWEAVDHYRADKGEFEAYARLVIRRRLIDYQRRESRHRMETQVAPEDFEEVAAGNTRRSWQHTRLITYQETRLQEEIRDLSQTLKEYGFSFDALPKASPKSKKTKKACAEAASFILSHPALITRMRRARQLPVAAVASGIRVSRKVVERHRNYIIAVVEILHGDYPELGAYLTVVREQVE